MCRRDEPSGNYEGMTMAAGGKDSQRETHKSSRLQLTCQVSKYQENVTQPTVTRKS